ncbi:MAG: NAD(P)-binding protein [Nitrospira sp.]|nr:NAD(P)-binding protein [bacterium]MBL7050361.1 NAD(P)-binding protein [Nitrospira sp.]
MITRRDFLNGVLLGAGMTLLDLPAPLRALAQTEGWYGYGGTGDYTRSHGNTEEIVREFHKVRDGKYRNSDSDIIDTEETYDMIIVGGGISGLSAAYEFKKGKRYDQKCLVLENHPMTGGHAKRNEFDVNGYKIIGPQASNAFVAINQKGVPGFEMFDELKVPKSFAYQNLEPGLKKLSLDRTSYGFMLWYDVSQSVGFFLEDSKGSGWVRDPWGDGMKHLPYSEKVKKDFTDWRKSMKRPYHLADFKRWFDTMTYKDYLEKELGLSSEIAEFADPIIASGLGLGCDSLSAYAAYQIGMPGFQSYSSRERKRRLEDSDWHSFPGGNDGFSRYLLKALIPEAIDGSNEFGDILNRPIKLDTLDNPDNAVRIRLEASVVDVRHNADPASSDHVTVVYTKGGKKYRAKAGGVVVTAAGWMAKHMVKDLPFEHTSAFNQLNHSPVMVVNVALTNWRFLYKLGLTGCRWFNGFGFSCNFRQPMIVGDYRAPMHPDKPVVLTFYVPYFTPGLPAKEQGDIGRKTMLSTSFAEYERQIKAHMTKVFGEAGFKADRDIAGIVLNRWLNAYMNPQPGYYFTHNGKKAPREVIRQGYGRIAFGHSEIDGHQNWSGAFSEGARAAKDVMARI